MHDLSPKRELLGLATLLLAAFACSNVRGGASPDSAIETSRWLLVDVRGLAVQASDSAHRPWIRFDSPAGTVSGNGGCNGFGGKYTRSDSSLRITQVISTKRACVANELNAQEQQYFGALDAANYFKIAGDTLTLFEAAAPPAEVARFVR